MSIEDHISSTAKQAVINPPRPMSTLESTIREIVRDEIRRLAPPEPVEATPDVPLVMTSRQVAEVLQCTPQHVNALIRAGALRAKSEGSRNLILRDDLMDYLRSDRRRPAMKRADRQRLRTYSTYTPK